MLYLSPSFKVFQWSAIHFAAVGLMTAAVIPATATAARATGDNYRECARDLLDAGIEADTAAAACALAFRPTEISNCVVDVVDVSSVTPVQALSACSRDRRPDEVATCVENIHRDLEVADDSLVLTSCHRSLLPERYSNCVVDLAEVIGYPAEESVARCIAAGYRPENVAPTFVPD